MVTECVNAPSAVRSHIHTFEIKFHLVGSNPQPHPVRLRTLRILQNTNRLNRRFRIFTALADLANPPTSPISGEVGVNYRRPRPLFGEIGEFGGIGAIGGNPHRFRRCRLGKRECPPTSPISLPFSARSMGIPTDLTDLAENRRAKRERWEF